MRISINDIKLRSVVGVYDWERNHKRNLLVDLSFEYKNTANYIDYDELINLTLSTESSDPLALIEDLARKILTLVENKYFAQLAWFSVTIKKPSANFSASIISATIHKEFAKNG